MILGDEPVVQPVVDPLVRYAEELEEPTQYEQRASGVIFPRYLGVVLPPPIRLVVFAEVLRGEGEGEEYSGCGEEGEG